MGHGASIHEGIAVILRSLKLFYQGTATSDSQGKRPMPSPRGTSAEDAVKRLHASPNSFNHRMLASLAKRRFEDLDVEKLGVLAMDSLMRIATEILPSYHPGGMFAPPEDDQRTLQDLHEALRLNNEPLVFTCSRFLHHFHF